MMLFIMYGEVKKMQNRDLGAETLGKFSYLHLFANLQNFLHFWQMNLLILHAKYE